MAESKQYITQTQNNGTVMISEDVIEAIVAETVAEVEGVQGLVVKPGADIADLIGKNWGKGMKIVIAENNELTISCNVQITYGSSVIEVAKNAQMAGLDGVVCSPLEAGMVKEACGAGFVTVTPGVRFADGEVGDQVRVTTPARAKEIGTDYIVVGRPITQAADPVAAYKRCVAEFVG